ncbi:MAG: hypothetical protein CSA58_07405, partial [Micrococcales bacterium]
AVRTANVSMRSQVDEDPELNGMGSTCTALLRDGTQLHLAHVGDSRGYVYADGELTQVTHDHTFVQHLIDTNQITEEEAERHPQRSVILRVVGHLDEEEIDTDTFNAVPGHRWLLCSDGLPRVVSAQTIGETLAGTDSPAATAERLVQLALAAGGPDNITVVVADVVDADERPPDTPDVVGAAALPGNMPAVSADGPAARAQRLTQPEDPPAPGPERPSTPSRPRWITFVLGVVGVAAALGLFVLGFRWWMASQYYVSKDADTVAVYRGRPEELGPLSLHERTQSTKLPVGTLVQNAREQVESGIRADNEADAQRILDNLWSQSSLCGNENAPLPPALTPTPSPTARPTEPTSPTLPVPSPAPGAPTVANARITPTPGGGTTITATHGPAQSPAASGESVAQAPTAPDSDDVPTIPWPECP